MVNVVSERWIKGCESALEKIRKLSAAEEKDRLDRIKAIKTSLGLMGRSLAGWMRWVNNPNTMANFSEDELEKMENHLSEVAETFIEYDIQASKLGHEKGLKRRRAAEKQSIPFII